MQQNAVRLPASTLLRHARRALLLLGGAFVWWLLVASGGTAQADDRGHAAPGHQTAVQKPASKPRVDVSQVVRRTTDTVTGSVREAPRRVSDTVAAATRPAPEPVRATAQSVAKAVGPTLESTTTRVAATVDATVRTVETVVDPVLREAGLGGVHVSPAPARAEATRDLRAEAPAAQRARVASEPPAQRPLVDAAGPSMRSDQPRHHGSDVPKAPTLPGGGVTGGGSGGVADLGALALLPAALRRFGRTWDDAGLPPGPAYPPGSSPD